MHLTQHRCQDTTRAKAEMRRDTRHHSNHRGMRHCEIRTVRHETRRNIKLEERRDIGRTSLRFFKCIMGCRGLS